eukprot:TRINITY_DN197_c0_g1_i5.p1 TRINITY_DN197_c0_g1~~TRINITY_DN197_c0_g1_i5.p1  ORF type:complete len:405 (-),score=145.19 TRINITY_DN197_c0_g1_i5:72-1109(-)
MAAPPALPRRRAPRRCALLSLATLAAAAVVAATAAAPAAAQKGAAFKKPPPNTDLRVFASAQVKSPFNEAIIDLTIVSERPTLSATIAASRFASATIRREVLAASVPARDIVTRDVGLSPRFNYTEGGRDLLGWVIRQNVRVTTERVGRVQALIRAIASTAGRNVQLIINSKRQVGSTEDLILRSLREATLAARAKADRIAASTGKVVKRVIFLGGNKGGWPRQYASNGVFTVASKVNGKFLLAAPDEAVADGDAEGRLEDIVRVGGADVTAAEAEVAARPDVHMEVSGATAGEDEALYGANPADREFDAVVELGSMAEAMAGLGITGCRSPLQARGGRSAQDSK